MRATQEMAERRAWHQHLASSEEVWDMPLVRADYELENIKNKQRMWITRTWVQRHGKRYMVYQKATD